MPDTMHDFPAINFSDKDIEALSSYKENVYAPISDIAFNKISSSFGIVLHMHQPTIPAETEELSRAGLISNLQYMMEHQNVHDNHNATVFLQCYSRMSDIIREMAAQGKNPRIMLDYSGNLLWGLKQMGEQKVLDNLMLVTSDKKYHRYVEWLGTTWSHAVVSSTPVPDIKLHLMAWRKHFASIFGVDAARRVKGFSPPEMHLPIHPDVCYHYVKSLKECGYQWLVAQEHSIENTDGSGIRRPHFPHRLVAKNSLGEVEEIVVLIKTQGSDNKLIGQMQPFYEAKARAREEYAGKKLPPFVLQVGDGENGGVMMNEFPPAYRKSYGEMDEQTVSLNGSEYLEFLKARGVNEKDFLAVQPVTQHRIWEVVQGYHPGACDEALRKIREKDPHYNLDKGSWTNDRSWVKGYEHILDPMHKLSVAFHAAFDGQKVNVQNARYRKALLYLLLSQTSCFRYWGTGAWTNYAQEIIRRGMAELS